MPKSESSENLGPRVDVPLKVTGGGQGRVHEVTASSDSLADWIAPLLDQRDASKSKGDGRRRCRSVVVVPSPRPYQMMPTFPPILPSSIHAHHTHHPINRQPPHSAPPHLPPNSSALYRSLNQQQPPSSNLHSAIVGHPLEHHEIPGVKWVHSVGKARRMYVSAGVSTFAEVMRPWVEKHYSRTFTSFSEVVVRALSFWDTLTQIEHEAWQERAIKEGKQDHCIYMRSPNWEQQANTNEHRRHEDDAETDEDDSDPDELPGPLIEDQEHEVQRFLHKPEKPEFYSNDVRQCPIGIAPPHLMTGDRRVSSNSSINKAGDFSSPLKAPKSSTAEVWERDHVSTHPHPSHHRHQMHHPHHHQHGYQHHRGGSTKQPTNWSTEKRKPQPFEGRNWTMARYTSSTRAV